MIPGGAKVIDASGKLVMPGGIDTSVHLQQTFMNASTQDDFYTGTKTQDLRRVDRAPYSGDVAAVANAGRKDSAPSEGDVPMRVTTRPGGIRDLHESSLVCQALKWMTTFLSGPLLESWLHLVDAPVVSGNRGNPRLTHSHRSLI